MSEAVRCVKCKGRVEFTHKSYGHLDEETGEPVLEGGIHDVGDYELYCGTECFEIGTGGVMDSLEQLIETAKDQGLVEAASDLAEVEA